ncbi:unnamed protein product, partial [Prorocentrum cordatum]
MVSSREGGMCGCIDSVPTSSRKVLIALAQKQGAQRMAMSFAFDALPAEAAAWAAVAEGLHAALPLTPLALLGGGRPCPPARRGAAAVPRRRNGCHSRASLPGSAALPTSGRVGFAGSLAKVPVSGVP